MQTKTDDNKIKIELITFDKLKAFAKGKTKGKTKDVLENFTLFVREENKIKQEGKSEPVKFKKALSLDQKIKDFFSSFIAKKTDEADNEPSPQNEKGIKSKIDIRADSPIKKNFNSPQKKTASTPNKPKKNIIPLIIALLFLVAGIILLSFSDSNLSNVNNFISGVIEKGKNVLGVGVSDEGDENELYELSDESQKAPESQELNEPIENQVPESQEVQEPIAPKEEIPEETTEETPVDYSSLNTQQLLGNSQIMEINLFAKDLTGKKKNFLKKIQQYIFGISEKELDDGAITKESVYNYIEQNLNLFSENEVYFLNIYKEDSLLTLDELTNIFGLKLIPGKEAELKERLATYKLLIYFEPKDVKVNGQIRLGMLFISKTGSSLSLDFFKGWETTMANDLRSLYSASNQKFLKSDKLFSDSTVSEQRRYINFTSDQLLSLDYAVAKDGVIIVTSKKFGTAVLKLLLSKDEVDGSGDTSSLEALESKPDETKATGENVPQ
ncbi:MAG: hypothetical protein U9Q72_00315 [Patescibacteria group bacterium]|nr:hypothetical protein [Patescibacteria group bacterium]